MPYKIYPPIGIARVGDSPDEWFIGPEIPGLFERPPNGYKSADCRIKRQGARFRIFAFEDDNKTPVLENGRPKEITLADAQITWRVQLGNIKGEADRFYQYSGFVQRNPNEIDRSGLKILTEELAISGADQQAKFTQGQFRKTPVALGELRTDEAGRLIVLGGLGVAQAIHPDGTPWPENDFPGTLNLYDNDDWYDDVSDGPVRARLVIDGKTEDAMPARVVVAPPAFAPAIHPVVSLYDRLYETLLDQTVEAIRPVPPPGPPSFVRDIQPILRAARDIRRVFPMVGSHQTLAEAVNQPLHLAAGFIVSKLMPPGATAPQKGNTASANMPKLFDDDKAESFPLTGPQYAAMQAWGTQPPGTAWVNDWPPAPVDPFPTPEGMTRAALEACNGRGLRPGIEAGRYLLGMQGPGEAKEVKLPPYVEAFRLADTVEPGAVTARMAVPWQRDFTACSIGYDDNAALGAWGWWPTHRPDTVYPEAGGEPAKWFVSGANDPGGGARWLIENWNQLGFVVEQKGELVSTERSVACRGVSVVMLREAISLGAVEHALAQAPGQPAILSKVLTVRLGGLRAVDFGIDLPADPVAVLKLAPTLTFKRADGTTVDLGYKATLFEVQSQNSLETQVLSFTYDLSFADASAFHDAAAQPIESQTLTVIAAKSTSETPPILMTGDAPLRLVAPPTPYIEDGPVPWLSDDLRVFRVVQGQPSPVPAAGPIGTVAPLDYIEKVVTLFNQAPAANHPFDSLAKDQKGSELQLYETDDGKPAFNFAVARVRYPGKTATAEDVRVFFRLFTTLAPGFDYDPATTYRTSDSFDSPAPRLGLDGAGHVINFPCFGSPRIDSAVSSVDTQQDALNRRAMLPALPGQSTSVAYFGCWIDNNQTALQFPQNPSPPDGPWPDGRVPLIQLFNGEHQCLVAEVAAPGSTIPTGATPAGDNRIAQRNLAWVETDNPGGPDTRTIQHSFAIKAPKPTPRGMTPVRPDELVIHWRDLPQGSRMRLYTPDLEAGEVLRLAAATYDYTGLARLDVHTLECLPGDVTYVPIPAGRSRDIAALLTVELPEGVRKGQQFNLTIDQLSADRRLQGTVQINIPVSVARLMLPAEKRRLSLLRYIALGKAPDDPWAAVLRRYIDQVAARVRGYGGDPDTIAPSPSGAGEAGKIKAVICRVLAVFFALWLAAFVLAGGLHQAPSWRPELIAGGLALVFGLVWLLVCKPPPWRILLAAGAGVVSGAGLLGAASLLGLGGPGLPSWLAVSAVVGAALLGLGALLKPKP